MGTRMRRLRQHTNAFDFIRLFAAGLVVWSHQHALMGLPEPVVEVFQSSFGGVGVLIFFAISGYLNTLSVVRHKSMLTFLIRRGLRIYPGLAVCVLFTVTLGAFVVPNIKPYFNYQLVSFIGKNITLFFGDKAGVSEGVFIGNSYPNALNGSLWTLAYEVKMYVLLAICFAAFRFKPNVLLVISAGGICLISFSAFNYFWLKFGAMFLAGCLIATIQLLKSLRVGVAVVVGLSCLFAILGNVLLTWYLLLAASFILIGAIGLPPSLRLPLDLSYGIYIYAWPIQQLSAMITSNFWIALLFSTLFTLLLALLSTLFIELPAQRFKRDLRRRTGAEEDRAVVTAPTK
jgi:peptidoglycan/LPS O-acetylase OafA/YrhL